MGYFSNGTEGSMYEGAHCRHCIHYDDCAVWDAHLLYNYDECNNKKSILHYLIPRKADGFNDKCKMFYSDIEHRRRVAAEAIALEIEMISDFELSDFNNIESCRTNLMQIHEAAMKLKSIIKEAGE